MRRTGTGSAQPSTESNGFEFIVQPTGCLRTTRCGARASAASEQLKSLTVSMLGGTGETSNSNLLCAFGGQVKNAAHRRRQCRAAAGLIHSAGRSRRVRYLVLPPDDNAALLRIEDLDAHQWVRPWQYPRQTLTPSRCAPFTRQLAGCMCNVASFGPSRTTAGLLNFFLFHSQPANRVKRTAQMARRVMIPSVRMAGSTEEASRTWWCSLGIRCYVVKLHVTKEPHQLGTQGDDPLSADGGQHGGAVGDARHAREQKDGRLQRSQEQARARKEEVACGRA